MKILIATDAWHPQVNGVVRTLSTTRSHLERLGHTVDVIHPGLFRSFPIPFYPSIRLALPFQREIATLVERSSPDAIHISTEATIGSAVRRFCLRTYRPFTTSYHTAFPDYAWRYARIPRSWTYSYLRRFHAPARAILVAASSLETELRSWGFQNTLRHWSRGVDTRLFRPRTERQSGRPVCLYVGRIAPEKNIEAFLKLELPYDKVVVGDGPQLSAFRRRYHGTRFLGSLHGEELAAAYRAADVLVFPSRTDTFGLVIIEALASGVPVAAYPAPGPNDILAGHASVGCLREDLRSAIDTALAVGVPAACVELARQYTWQRATQQFLDGLVCERPPQRHAA
jgi:glycosyltransferase involved in cell wall biosynthesis